MKGRAVAAETPATAVTACYSPYDPEMRWELKSMRSTELVTAILRLCGKSFYRPLYTVIVKDFRTQTQVFIVFLTTSVFSGSLSL